MSFASRRSELPAAGRELVLATTRGSELSDGLLHLPARSGAVLR